MKKVTLLIAMAALVIFTGCNKEKETGTALKASIEQFKDDSKTSLHPISDDEAEIHWTAGDKILVNNGTSSAIFTLSSGQGTGNGIFRYPGEFEISDYNIVAVYPSTATISGDRISITLPEEQTLTEVGTFANGANPMLATYIDENGNLAFRSICGGLGISLIGDNIDITGIEIVSLNENEKLNGTFEMATSDLCLSAISDNNGTNRIMLNCNTTLTMTEPKEFFIVLPEGTLYGGFAMNVYNGGNEPIFRKYSFGGEYYGDHGIDWNVINMMSTLEVTICDTHDYVDLGLPSGLLWATCNVSYNIDAETPEDYGDYFAWGETMPKMGYKVENYKYYNQGQLTKYTESDGLTTLLPEDDAATANWGNGWRMPTDEEWEELYNNTTSVWTTQNGVNGRLFTAPNGNSLFLPAAGYRSYYSNDGEGFGYYWSSSLFTEGTAGYATGCAMRFFFSESQVYIDGWGEARSDGKCVRAVRAAR